MKLEENSLSQGQCTLPFSPVDQLEKQRPADPSPAAGAGSNLRPSGYEDEP